MYCIYLYYTSSIPHYRQKNQSFEICFTYIFADSGSFDSAPAFGYTTLGAVRHNRCFSRTAKSVILGVKKRSVLSKILIGFSENPLDLGEIGGDFRTRIFTAFSMRTGAKSPENTAFSGFSHLPLSSVKFRQVRFLPLDSKSVCLNGHAGSNPALPYLNAPLFISTNDTAKGVAFAVQKPIFAWETPFAV